MKEDKLKKAKTKLLLNKIFRKGKNLYKIVSIDLQTEIVKFQNIQKSEIIETMNIDKFINNYQEIKLV
jgi:hypothetical protein